MAGADRHRRLPGLDGLRAIAVAAVVLFHVAPDLLPGGFLGVDVFFVISGFLITRLLLIELGRTGGLRLGRFYARRARRLLPAVALVMLAVVAAGTTFWRDQLPTLWGSVLSSLGYVTNWWLIADDQSYFVATGRPPMLQHLWSLAIEEQYYLLWSVAVLVIMRSARRRRRPRWLSPSGPWRVAQVATVLALLSTAVMALFALRQDLPYGADVGRVYFGTDTHAMGLLLGSAAGALSVGGRPGGWPLPAYRGVWPTDLLAVIGLAGLGWSFVVVDEFQPWLYRGGFLLVDTVALLLVVAVVRRGSGVGRLLEHRLPRWLGQRSYSIYLWHWPIVVITRPGLDLVGPVALIDALRVALILALAAITYRYVEEPIRAGRRPMRPAPVWPFRNRMTVPALQGLAAAACAAMLVVAGQAGPKRPYPLTAPVGSIAPADPNPAASGEDSSGPVADKEGARLRLIHPPASLAPALPPAPAPAPSPVSAPPALSAFGDSVLLGARPAIEASLPVQGFDAKEGRQANLILDDVDGAAAAGALAPVVLIHVGNNGVISPGRLAETLSRLADRQQVLLVNDRVPRAWEEPNNRTLAQVGADFGNTTLVDWHAASEGHPDWFVADGLHLQVGARPLYADLVSRALRR